jgi:hypothetical protein
MSLVKMVIRHLPCQMKTRAGGRIQVLTELFYASKKNYQLKKDDRTVKLHHRSTKSLS